MKDAKVDDDTWFTAFQADHPVEWDAAETSDSFAREMYVRMPKTQALREVMAHPAGHEAFVRFLRTDYADDNVWYYAAVEDTRNGKPVDSSALSADLKAIVNGYITPESPANVELPIETKEAVSLLTKGTATDKEILLTLLEAQDEALRILATGAFPKFLKSQLYADWRAQVKAQAAAAAAAAAAEAAAATDNTSNTSTHVEGREPAAAASDGHYTDVPPSSIQALMHEVRDTSPCPALSVPPVTSPPPHAPPGYCAGAGQDIGHDDVAEGPAVVHRGPPRVRLPRRRQPPPAGTHTV